MSQHGSHLSEGGLSHKTALLDIFCKIDVVNEIQSDNTIVIDVFDDIFTIDAFFEIVKSNTVEHNGTKLYFPQMCADVFTCLPDRYIDDICANDYLMDSFFRIPTETIDSRMASCFCQMVERFVSAVPVVMFTYLQMRVDAVLDLLLKRIHLSSYLNCLRYLLDIPTLDGECWWGNSDIFISKILGILENEEATYNVKELLLSITQRATVYNKQEKPRSSICLLESLMHEDNLRCIVNVLMKHLNIITDKYKEYLSNPEEVVFSSYIDFVSRTAYNSMEVASTCFLLLSRLFWKYSHGLTTGRGGYNTCFNTQSIPIHDLINMGGINNKIWIRRLSKLCKSNLSFIFNAIRDIVDFHSQLMSVLSKRKINDIPSFMFIKTMAPKVVLAFCEFFYHYVHNRNEPKTLLSLLHHHYIDCVLWIMEVYPMVTNIHINIVDVLITIVYSNNISVITFLFKDTHLLRLILDAVSNPKISPLKSQLNIFLQAVAVCCRPTDPSLPAVISNNRTVENRGDIVSPRIDPKSNAVSESDDVKGHSIVVISEEIKENISDQFLYHILLSCNLFEEITRLVDFYHIYEPLVAISEEMETGTNRNDAKRKKKEEVKK